MAMNQIVIRNYERIKRLGKGSYGDVYEVVDKENESHFALKEIFKDDENVYLVLELCSGGDLSKYIRSFGKLDERIALNFLHQISCGLSFLNDLNIIHRDLKPANILLSEFSSNAVLKLADFGLARQLEETEAMAQTQCGSPVYMAPEIISNRNYDSRVDLWSTGCIFYEMLQGTQPYKARSIPELFRKIQTKAIVMPKGISDSSEQLLTKLLTANPDKRLTLNQLSGFFVNNLNSSMLSSQCITSAYNNLNNNISQTQQSVLPAKFDAILSLPYIETKSEVVIKDEIISEADHRRISSINSQSKTGETTIKIGQNITNRNNNDVNDDDGEDGFVIIDDSFLQNSETKQSESSLHCEDEIMTGIIQYNNKCNESIIQICSIADSFAGIAINEYDKIEKISKDRIYLTDYQEIIDIYLIAYSIYSHTIQMTIESLQCINKVPIELSEDNNNKIDVMTNDLANILDGLIKRAENCVQRVKIITKNEKIKNNITFDKPCFQPILSALSTKLYFDSKIDCLLGNLERSKKNLLCSKMLLDSINGMIIGENSKILKKQLNHITKELEKFSEK